MAGKFTINRVGHVGIYVSDLDRSIAWYTQVLGLTLTGRWPFPGSGEIVFLRFGENHHDIVLMPHRRHSRAARSGCETRCRAAPRSMIEL